GRLPDPRHPADDRLPHLRPRRRRARRGEEPYMSTRARRSDGGRRRQRDTADDRPLTDAEYDLVQRLFGDPFSFPLAFKTWIPSYVETSGIQLPQSSIVGLSSKLKELGGP